MGCLRPNFFMSRGEALSSSASFLKWSQSTPAERGPRSGQLISRGLIRQEPRWVLLLMSSVPEKKTNKGSQAARTQVAESARQS